MLRPYSRLRSLTLPAPPFPSLQIHGQVKGADRQAARAKRVIQGLGARNTLIREQVMTVRMADFSVRSTVKVQASKDHLNRSMRLRIHTWKEPHFATAGSLRQLCLLF